VLIPSYSNPVCTCWVSSANTDSHRFWSRRPWYLGIDGIIGGRRVKASRRNVLHKVSAVACKCILRCQNANENENEILLNSTSESNRTGHALVVRPIKAISADPVMTHATSKSSHPMALQHTCWIASHPWASGTPLISEALASPPYGGAIAPRMTVQLHPVWRCNCTPSAH